VPKVYVVLVNWNRWKDTIECLESVFRLRYKNFRVVVCDNSSGDNSVENIQAWAAGKLAAGCDNPTLRSLTEPPVAKPVPTLRVAPGEQFQLGGGNERLILIETGNNLGFAGGNNVALRLVLETSDSEYVWLLNNDTVVDPGALDHLVETLGSEIDAGMCGSTLLYYHEPEKVQALGGSVYNVWTARGGHLGEGLDRNRLPSRALVEGRLRYVVGASMLVRREFLEQVGIMNEDYFLYFEEIDWATRGRSRFRLTWSPESIVYHKEGTSIGTAQSPMARSGLSEMYATRNRVLFTRSYFFYAIPTACAAILLSAAHRMLIGRFDSSRAIWRGLLAGLGAPSN